MKKVNLHLARSKVDTTSILGCKFDYSLGYRTNEHKEITLKEWFDLAPSYKDSKREDKEHLPRVMFQSRLKDLNASHSNENVKCPTGFYCLDVDKAENLESTRNKMEKCPYIICVGTTLSKQGLWGLSLIKPSGDVTKDVLKKVKSFFEEVLKVKLDSGSTAFVFGRTISYDERFLLKSSFVPLGFDISDEPDIRENKKYSSNDGHKYTDTVVASLLSVEEGGRNNALNRAGYCLRIKIEKEGFDEEYVKDSLFRAANKIGLSQRETVATLKSCGIIK